MASVPNYRHSRADTHQHVGVIERHAAAIEGLEDNRLVAHLRAHSSTTAGWVRGDTARIGDPLGMIENQAAGALQKAALRLVMSEIEQSR